MLATGEGESIVESFLVAYERSTLDYYDQPGNSDVRFDRGDHYFLEKYLKKTDSVLEVGCGRGNFTYDLGFYARDVVAIDPVKRYVYEIHAKLAKAGANHVGVRVAGIDNLPPGRYDVIFFGRSLSQLASPKRALELAKERLDGKGRILVVEAEMWPDAGGGGPTHLKRVAKAAREVGCRPEQVEDELGIPFCIHIPWIEKLAPMAGMEVTRSERLGEPNGFSDEDMRHFIAELRPKETATGE